jgi:hypothetical protein
MDPYKPSRTVRLLNTGLQDPGVLKFYRDQGFNWIRRVETKSYNHILRSPSVGCMVEIKTFPDVRCAHLDTQKARRLIKTISYFTNYMYI